VETAGPLIELLICGAGACYDPSAMDDKLKASLDDVFRQFFGARKAGPTRGQDLRVDLAVDLVDIADGCVRDVEVHRGKLCRTCTGTGYEPATSVTMCTPCKGTGRTSKLQCTACLGRGRVGVPCDGCMGMGTQPALEKFAVTVPAGVGDGVSLRLANKGNEIRDGAAGHLYVVLATRKHAQLARRDADVLVEVWVSHELATNGGRIAVPALHGERMVDVPVGATDRDVLVVRGCGMQVFGAPKTPMPNDAAPGDTPYRELDLSGRGNLVVTLRVRERGAKGFLKRFFKTDRL
jgi:molecular chaperone DnaJ